MKQSSSHNLAIVVTDIAGFTSATSRQTREQNAQWLQTHAAILRPIFDAFGGTVRKEMGDAYLCTFPSPTDAVLCGTVILDKLWAYNRTAPPLMRLDIRVVVNMGEVRVDRAGILGEPVNVAAKVEEVAEGGHVTLTEAVFLTMNRSEVELEPWGQHQLAGLPEPVTLYRVKQTCERPASAEELPASYPYSGLHLHRLNAPQPARPATETSGARLARVGASALDGVQRVSDAVSGMPLRRVGRWAGVAALALGVLAGGAYAVRAWRSDPFRRIEDRIAAGDVEGASTAWDMAERQHAKPEWRMLYLLGRISALEKHCGDVLDAYKDAVTAREALATDAALNRDVVACLEDKGERAAAFIRERSGKAAVEALGALVMDRKADVDARFRAYLLLDELKAADDVDAGVLLVDVVRSDLPCSRRREAALQLAALKDKGTLGDLRALVEVSTPPSGKLAQRNACLVGILREAVRALE